MFELTLTSGQLAAIQMVAEALKSARYKLLKAGLLDPDNAAVTEQNNTVEEVIDFVEIMWPLFGVGVSTEVYETAMVVDSYCLAALTRVLQKTLDDSHPILDQQYEELMRAPKDERYDALREQFIENTHFHLILDGAYHRVVETFTTPDPEAPVLH